MVRQFLLLPILLVFSFASVHSSSAEGVPKLSGAALDAYDAMYSAASAADASVGQANLLMAKT